MLNIGDLVFDESNCKRGLVIETKEWQLIGCEEAEWEYTILYEGGDIDTAYDREVEVIE